LSLQSLYNTISSRCSTAEYIFVLWCYISCRDCVVSVEMRGWLCTVNWKGVGKKQPWSILRYYS